MKRHLFIFVLLFALFFAINALLKRQNFHEVVPGEVFRSAQLSGSELKRKTLRHDLRSIINLRQPRSGEDWYQEEMAAVSDLGITHHTIGMFQGSPRIDQIMELHDLIKTVERPFLVHCRAGADRTGLASVMTLLLEGESDLDLVQQQVTWKYGAVRDDSMGKVFLAEYRGWLAGRNVRHTPETLHEWLQTDYVDPTGNIHFLVHPIDGQAWLKPLGGYGEGVEFKVSRKGRDTFEMDGWAFDTGHISLLAGLRVFLGGVEFAEVEYGIHSPWLMDDFGKDEWLDSGWAASHAMDEFADGCHDLEFIFERLDGSHWQSPPAGRICID